MENEDLPIFSAIEELNSVQIAHTQPKAVKRKPVELVSFNEVLLEIGKPHSTSILFPRVEHGKENIKIRFAWFFDPPGLGKTVKCRGMAEAAYNSGLYNKDKIQILEGTDLEAMFLKIKQGSECVIFVLNDAHGKHSSLRMSGDAAEERNDFIFMARHKFREYAKRKNGVVIVIANAQIERSVSPWLRTLGDIKCSTGLLADDDDKQTQLQWFGRPGVRKLKEYFREIKEKGHEEFKSKCVCYICGREEKDYGYNYRDKDTAPVGTLDIPPLNRICLDCKYEERGFFIECPNCGSENYEVPFEKFIEFVPDLTSSQRENLKREEDYKFLDDIIQRCRAEGLVNCKSHFSKILTRRIDTWYAEDGDKLKQFEDNRNWFITRVIGELKGSQADAEEEAEEEDVEQGTEDATKDWFSTERFEYDLNDAVDRCMYKYKLNKMQCKVYKMVYDQNLKMTQNQISNELHIPQSTISKWTGPRGRVSGLIRVDMGNEYEIWVKKHLEEGYRVPGVFEREDIEEVIRIGGSTNEPDLIILYRNGDIDVASLKCYNETGAITIHTQYTGTCDIRPEMIAFLELQEKRKFVYQHQREIVLKEGCSVRLIILLRNISWRQFEAADIVRNPKEMGDKITFSEGTLDAKVIKLVEWVPKSEFEKKEDPKPIESCESKPEAKKDLLDEFLEETAELDKA